MFSDMLEVTASNDSFDDDKIIFGFKKFALQLQDIDPDVFKGQTLTVDVGSVEDALDSEERFGNSLKTSEMVMKVLENSTAAVHLPHSFFSSIMECMEDDDSNSGQLRLSYSVFLTDILFQSRNQSVDIGSIIVTTRLRCAKNVTLPNPISILFRTIEQVYTCIFYESIYDISLYS